MMNSSKAHYHARGEGMEVNYSAIELPSIGLAQH